MVVGVIPDHSMVSFSFAELFQPYVEDRFIPSDFNCYDSSFEKLDNFSTYCVQLKFSTLSTG